jgi:cytochrome o ubiquinol oxidase subunit 1
MPKNTPVGMYVAGFAFLFGFAAVWHIWWLFIVALLGGILTIIIRTNDEDSEYVVPAAEIAENEARLAVRKQNAA